MRKSRKIPVLVLALILMMNLAMLTAVATGQDQQNHPQEGQVHFTDVDEIVYTVDAVNVRSGPGLQYEVIATLPYGSAIRRTGVGDNQWSRVSYMGQDAYMYSPLLTTKDPNGGSNVPDTPTQADTSRLLRQIAIANGLQEGSFTQNSWANLKSALEIAERARKSGTQEEVDRAADELEAAIAALVHVDYGNLDLAISEALECVRDDSLFSLVDRLYQTIDRAEQLRVSGDQEAVDACTAEIREILDSLKAQQDQMQEVKPPEIVIQEVEVQVPPTDDYCNIGSHRIWPVLFFVSLALNAALGIMLAVVLKKKNYRAQDVPLVDYDIDDDM